MISLYWRQFTHTIDNEESVAMTLWILFCRMQSGMDTLFMFYASDREHAEQQATKLLEAYPYERLDLKAYPCGFVIHYADIPGTIEEKRL